MAVNELLSPIYTSSLLQLLATNFPDHRFVESQTKDVGFAGTHSIIALGHSLGVVRALSIFCVDFAFIARLIHLPVPLPHLVYPKIMLSKG